MRCTHHGPRRAPLDRIPLLVRQPFELVHINKILGMSTTQYRNCCNIVVIDGMRGYTSAGAYPAATSAAIVDSVDNQLISVSEFPKKIQTGNGSHFHGAFHALHDKWGTKRSWLAACQLLPAIA